jgi:Bacteriophage tail sheath protein
MPPNLTFFSPGVQTRELDFSAYSRGPGLTTLGLIGVFEKGPVGVPVTINSMPEAQRIFGAYLPSFYSMHALKQFFDNGGQQATIVRTAHYTDITDASTSTALKAAITLVDRAGTPLNTLNVRAVNEGVWANGATGGLAVAIEDASVDTATGFRLSVYVSGVRVEQFDNLSMSSTSSDYVETRINGYSDYITVTDMLSATAAPNNRPAIIVSTVTGAKLTGGVDGAAGIVDADFIGNEAAHTGLHAFDGNTTVNLIAAPGRSGATMVQALLDYAAARKDVFAICDTLPGVSVSGAVTFRKQTSGTPFDSSYGGLYYPWLKLLDPATGNPRVFPPSGAVAGIMAGSDAVANVWGAPAGYQRGIVRQCLGLETLVTEKQANLLFPEGINPIVQVQGVGFVVMGQNTLQRRASATDRINVRRMLIYVEKTLGSFANSLLFEPNNKQTWEAFKRFANPFLQGVKDGQGVYDFIVKCDETTNTPQDIDQNRMNIFVYLKPTKTAEFITLNFAITTTGASFSELFGR